MNISEGARYCPNCSAQLRPPEAHCWNCGAVFGTDAGWRPTETPIGVFERRDRPTSSPPVESHHEAHELHLGSLFLKALLYLTFLVCWFFVGGFFSVGPQIAHNIEKTVGPMALYGTFWAWVVLPVSAFAVLVKPNSTTLAVLGLNTFVWLSFLACLYIRWAQASSHTGV